MESYLEPEATGLLKSEVFKIAENFALEVGFLPGDRIEPVVQNLGGFLQYSSVGEQGYLSPDDGSLYVDGPNNFRIRLSAFTGPERDRFTIAHELGHYVLHSKRGKKTIVAKRFGSNPVEWEANWFAAAFLMPEDDFREKCQRASTLSQVASRYQVSRKAAEVRMTALGLLPLP